MAKSYFVIPDTGTIVYDGDTVLLAEYPNVLAVAAYGWYKYNQSSKMGWHFVILPTNETVPATDVDLSLLTVVSSQGCPPCPPPSPCPPPFPTEDRTFITLDSMAQLQKMPTMFMPNGRIIRVNDRGDGKPGYYEWNVLTQNWDDWDISGVGPTPVPTNVAKIEIEDAVTSVDSARYTDEYTKFTFKASKPLCDTLGIAENTVCELYYVAPFQVLTAAESQDLFIRRVISTTPIWESTGWFASKDSSRISAIEEKVDVWVQNDRLENVLTGAPRLSDEELNEMLEARLNGEDVILELQSRED